jgi:hypothetical protein
MNNYAKNDSETNTTNFESFIVIGVLIMATPLIGSSFPDLAIMLDVQWDNVVEF